MAFNLIEVAEARWRTVNAPHLVALIAPAPNSRTTTKSSAPMTRPPRRLLQKI
jgi:hypothetical protein